MLKLLSGCCSLSWVWPWFLSLCFIRVLISSLSGSSDDRMSHNRRHYHNYLVNGNKIKLQSRVMVWIPALEINLSQTNHYWGCSNQAWEECIVLSYYIEDCVNGIIVILHQSHIFRINTQLVRRDISLADSSSSYFLFCSTKDVVCRRRNVVLPRLDKCFIVFR